MNMKKMLMMLAVAAFTLQLSTACTKLEQGSINLDIPSNQDPDNPNEDDPNEDDPNQDDPNQDDPNQDGPLTFTLDHPCAYVSQADIDRVKAKVAEANSSDPVYASWLKFTQNGFARETYTARPVEILVRGDAKNTGVSGENYIRACEDAAAAFQLALRWKISGEAKYADASVKILNEWADVCKKITANDNNQYLLCGFQGYTFANAAELLRDYEGWAAKDFEDFKQWMLKVWYEKNYWFISTHGGSNTCSLHYWPNWELCNIMSIMAIGILTDDQEKINYAYEQFRNGQGSCAINNMIPYDPVPDPSNKSTGMLAQNMESGRDQGHATLVISLAAELAQMAYNVGLDFFSMENNKLLAMFEYTAKYNVKVDGRFITTTMPFTPFTYCGGAEGLCGCNGGKAHNHGADHEDISDAGRGTIRPCWDLIYNHYTKVKGMPESAVYYSKLFAEQLRYTNGQLTGDGGSGDSRYGGTSAAYDQIGWGTMLFTR